MVGNMNTEEGEYEHKPFDKKKNKNICLYKLSCSYVKIVNYNIITYSKFCLATTSICILSGILLVKITEKN